MNLSPKIVVGLLGIFVGLFFFLSDKDSSRTNDQTQENVDVAAELNEADSQAGEPAPIDRKEKVIRKSPTESVGPEALAGLDPNQPQSDRSKYPFRVEEPGHIEFTVTKKGYALAFGDILLGKAESGKTGDRGLHRPKKSRLWPSSTIPYLFDESLKDKSAVLEAIDYFAQKSEIRLVSAQPEDEDALIFVFDAEHCASYLGRIGGVQPILVAPRCKRKDMIHEIMHALGFVHEQSRADRDRYVEIIWDQIQPKFYNQFHMIPDSMVHAFEGRVFDFDYNSIMLYHETAFSKKPIKPTMKSKTSRPIQPNQEDLSRSDLDRLHFLYGS